MERLTFRDEFRQRWQINNDPGHVIIDDLNYAVGKAIDRLAAYEDTGLTPEDVAELARSKRKEAEAALEKEAEK